MCIVSISVPRKVCALFKTKCGTCGTYYVQYPCVYPCILICILLCLCVCPIYLSKKGTWFFPVPGKEVWHFCYLGAHAKIQNPSCLLSGRKAMASEERENNGKYYYSHYVCTAPLGPKSGISYTWLIIVCIK